MTERELSDEQLSLFERGWNQEWFWTCRTGDPLAGKGCGVLHRTVEEASDCLTERYVRTGEEWLPVEVSSELLQYWCP